jgi:hypothetical protein
MRMGSPQVARGPAGCGFAKTASVEGGRMRQRGVG